MNRAYHMYLKRMELVKMLCCIKGKIHVQDYEEFGSDESEAEEENLNQGMK